MDRVDELVKKLTVSQLRTLCKELEVNPNQCKTKTHLMDTYKHAFLVS